MDSISGAALITDVHGRVLLLRQGYRARRWTLPGGRVEPGESPREAALRETHEETGLDARIDCLHGVYHKHGGNSGLRFVFRAWIDPDGRAKPKVDGAEITDWTWCHPADPPGKLTRTARRVLAELAGDEPREAYAEL